jgi:hypothetical protein
MDHEGEFLGTGTGDVYWRHYATRQRLIVAENLCTESLGYSTYIEQSVNDDESEKSPSLSQESITESLPLLVHSNDVSFGCLPSNDQCRKDVERDRLIINGIFCNGAEIGYDSLHEHITSLLKNEIAQHSLNPPLNQNQSSALRALSSLVLRKASRTLSGGASFAALAPHLGEGQQPIPISMLASPINIRIRQGATPQCILKLSERDEEVLGAASLHVSIETTTVFSIRTMVAMDEEPSASISPEECVGATFVDEVAVPLSSILKLAGRGGDEVGVIVSLAEASSAARVHLALYEEEGR